MSELKLIGCWRGNNFSLIIQEIAKHNTEVCIKIIGKRLIINDRHVDYYQSIIIGDEIYIPIYPECLVCDEVEEEACIQPKYVACTQESEALMREWGLI